MVSCDFGWFFESTPRDLVEGGLYKKIAIDLSAWENHIHISAALLAKELGARSVSLHMSMLERTMELAHRHSVDCTSIRHLRMAGVAHQSHLPHVPHLHLHIHHGSARSHPTAPEHSSKGANPRFHVEPPSFSSICTTARAPHLHRAPTASPTPSTTSPTNEAPSPPAPAPVLMDHRC